MSRFNPSPVSLSVTLGLMFSASAFAQDATKTDETMVVTAAGYAQVIQNAPASISVISREDLESRYYRDVTDALKSVPGVTVTEGAILPTSAFVVWVQTIPLSWWMVSAKPHVRPVQTATARALSKVGCRHCKRLSALK